MTQTFTQTELDKVTSTIAFIAMAHEGQTYGDMPYFYHPMQVAMKVDDPTLDEYLAALLHDVIEDTDYDAGQLLGMFTPETVAMVELLTKDESLDYRQNIQRIIDSGNVGAMKVKLADNRVNFGGDKSQMSEARRTKLNTRYAMSIEMLETALKEVA